MTMPSPRRLARQSIGLLIRRGMSKQDAARTVTILCDEATAIIWRRAPDMDLTWLAEIADEASRIRSQHYDRLASSPTWPDRVADFARRFDRLHGPNQDAAAVYDSAYPVVARLLDQATDAWRQRHPERPGA